MTMKVTIWLGSEKSEKYGSVNKKLNISTDMIDAAKL